METEEDRLTALCGYKNIRLIKDVDCEDGQGNIVTFPVNTRGRILEEAQLEAFLDFHSNEDNLFIYDEMDLYEGSRNWIALIGDHICLLNSIEFDLEYQPLRNNQPPRLFPIMKES